MSSVGLCEVGTWPASLGAASCTVLGRSHGAAVLPDCRTLNIGILLMCACPKAPQATCLAAGECQVPPPHGTSAWRPVGSGGSEGAAGPGLGA